METRFPHIPTQESLDRLEELDRRKRRRAAAERATRTFFSILLILTAQVLLILAVASRHEAWPF